MRRPLLILSVAALLALGCSACGGGNHATVPVSSAASGSVAAGGSFRGDEDRDDQGRDSGYDSDDGEILDYGHAANASDEQAVAALVERYYAAASAGDAARACALIYFILAETIPEEYAHPPGPPYLRGASTCKAVLSLVFKRFHAQLSQSVEVTGVRVDGDLAYALLGSKTMPAAYIEVKREGDAWKIDRVLAAPLQ